MPAIAKQVTIRGTTYPSQQAAADALKLTRQAIYMAKKQGRLESVGLNPKGKNHGKRVEIDGRVYESIYAAAKHNGIPYDTLREYYLEHV